jgi:hypothetical protein
MTRRSRSNKAAPSLVLAILLVSVMPCLAESTSAHDPPRHICGSRWAAQERAAGRVDSMPMRHHRGAARIASNAQDSITVGTELEFPVFGVVGTVSATCRYVGDKVFVFVENRQWDTEGGSVFQSHVDGLATLFEQSTPADSQRGIYDLSVETFGAPPDVDGHEQVFLLIVDLPFPGLLGLFDANVADHAIPELRRDVICLDELAVRRQSYLARGTLAHEFQHLIHWNWDQDEEVWLDEGLSGYAEELVGFPDADPLAVPAFLGAANTPLAGFFKGEGRYYGATYLFVTYLAQRYGQPLISQIVAEARNGIFGIEDALEHVGEVGEFEDAWTPWILANMTGGDAGFDYAALAGRRADSYEVESLPLPLTSGFAEQWGAVSILFRTSGNLAIDFDGDSAGRYRVWSYAWRDGSGELLEVVLDDAHEGRALSSAADSVLLVVGRTSLGGGNFTVEARSFVPTAIVESGTLPTTVSLGKAYPNPFNSTVQVPFALSADGDVKVDIVDVLGASVWRQTWSRLVAGDHRFTWDGLDGEGRAVATGVYYVRLQVAGGDLVTPIMLLR